MEAPERDEPDVVAEDVEDLEVEPDEAENVKGGNWGTAPPVRPPGPIPGG